MPRQKVDDGQLDVEQRIHLLTNKGVLDLSSSPPEFLNQLLSGGFLDPTHDFISLHNRKQHITDVDRERMYARNGAGRLVVNDPADGTWTSGFTVRGDEQTQLSMARVQRVIRQALPGADKWGRLYGMGFMVLGMNDGRGLAQPLGKATKLTWAHAFSKRHVEKIIWDTDITSPTYGQPRIYMVRANRPGAGPSGEAIPVHADRIIPLIENSHVNPLWGSSILDPAWNDLEDRASLGWASAESYHAGASPKFVLKTARPLSPAQETQIDGQTQQFRSNVRNMMKLLSSMDLVPLTKGSDIAPPLEHLVANTILLSEATGIPFSRFFKYHITSGDGLDWAAREWYEFLSLRQRSFGTIVVESIMDRLAKAGILTPEQAESEVLWNPPRVQTRDDIAKTLRNESIAWASVGQTGYVPKEIKDYMEKAPSDLVVPALAKGPTGGTGEKTIQKESKKVASTKNQSRKGRKPAANVADDEVTDDDEE